MPNNAKQFQTANIIESPMAGALEKRPSASQIDTSCQMGAPLGSRRFNQQSSRRLSLMTAYELERRALAERFGIRADFLDRGVSELAEEEEVAPFLEPDAPWEEAVLGSELLDEIYGNIRRYITLSNEAALGCALWVLFTHTHDAFEISPLLLIHSPAPECGKSSLLEVLAAMAPKALILVSITPATVFRLTDKFHPTLFFDEGDAQGKEQLEALRGIMNAGHKKGTATVPRMESDKASSRCGVPRPRPASAPRASNTDWSVDSNRDAPPETRREKAERQAAQGPPECAGQRPKTLRKTGC